MLVCTCVSAAFEESRRPNFLELGGAGGCEPLDVVLGAELGPLQEQYIS